MENIRLNRFIAMCGVCSRRKAETLIKEGLISVNNKRVTSLTYKVLPKDIVFLRGGRILPEKKEYLLLNKPKGYITTMDDEKDRKTVVSLIKNASQKRLVPVGRLDRETTGLLLFTNDGLLAKKLMHPKYNIKKIYHARLNKKLLKKDFLKIKKGLFLEDGFVRPDNFEYVENNYWNVKIEIHIGRNRIVRRIFEHLGYAVLGLDRIEYAFLTKHKIPIGKWRILIKKELKALKKITNLL